MEKARKKQEENGKQQKCYWVIDGGRRIVGFLLAILLTWLFFSSPYQRVFQVARQYFSVLLFMFFTGNEFAFPVAYIVQCLNVAMWQKSWKL